MIQGSPFTRQTTDFIAQTFGDELHISDAALAQLLWCVHDTSTPEQGVVNITEPRFIEVKRALSRLHSLERILAKQQGYQSFIQSQKAEDDFNKPLTQTGFEYFTDKFATFDPLFIDVLKTATIINSTTLSPNARRMANEVLGLNNYTIDSVLFMADCFKDFEQAKAIYPLINDLLEKYPEAEQQLRIRKLLTNVFLPMHYRHMMYTEGNQNMFSQMRELIKAGKFDEESQRMWWAFWVINITGFRGHIEPKGAFYLTENTFQAIKALDTELELLFQDPEHDVLGAYLETRAKGLALDRFPLNPRERQVLAHIGAMLRLFSPMEGESLYAGFCLIPSKQRQKLIEAFFQAVDPTMPTPTYAPALFSNIMDWRKQGYPQDSVLKSAFVHVEAKQLKNMANNLMHGLSIVDVVGILPAYLKAVVEYQRLRKEGKLDLKLPLCFRVTAVKEQIAEIYGHLPLSQTLNIFEQVDVAIDSVTGNVSLQKKAQLELAGDLERQLGVDFIDASTSFSPYFDKAVAEQKQSKEAAGQANISEEDHKNKSKDKKKMGVLI